MSDYTQSATPWKTGKTVAIMLLLMAVGFYLRYRCLGCLGFRWDEDLTALAVKALAETGVPELPSGMIYTRFYPLQWIMATSTTIFGFSEFALRLPSVVFSMLLIPITFVVTSRIFDSKIALIITAAFALSFNEVEMARTARMYAPFFLVFLLTSYAIYLSYYKNPERLFSPTVMLLAILALSLHQLAYSLAIFLVLAIPINPTARRSVSLIFQAAVIGVLFLLTKSVQEGFFYRGQLLAEQSGAAIPTESSAGLIDAVLSQIALPKLALLQSLLSTMPVLGSAVLLLGIILSARAWRSGGFGNWPGQLIATGAVVAAALHQFSLAVILLGLLVVCGGAGIAKLKAPDWTQPASAVLLLLVFWIGAVIWMGTLHGGVDGVSLSWRKIARSFVDYPNFRLFWSYVLEYPLLSPALLLGSMWALHGIASRRPDPRALFLGAGFWCVLFVNGILETQYEFFRYNMHLHWFFFTLAIIGIVKLPMIAMELGFNFNLTAIQARHSQKYLLATAAIATLIAVNPLAALLTSDRDYREDGTVFRILNLDTYPDFATPAAYIRERLTPDDRIYTLDPREYWNYIGRVDFWIWSHNYESQTFRTGNIDRDLYLAIPVLHSLDDLQQALNRTGPGNAWIVYSRSRLERTPWVSDDIKAFLGSLDDQVVYTGRDDNTIVVKLPPPIDARFRSSGGDMHSVTSERPAASQDVL